MNYIGLEFKGYQYQDMKVIEYMEKFKMYYVEKINVKGISTNELMKKNDINLYLNKQDEILKSKNKMSKINFEEKEEKEKEYQEYNFLYGYCKDMYPMQKAKILKVLNKTLKYDNKTMTRKEFIYQLINDNYTVKIIDKMLSSSKKVAGERINKYQYNVPIIQKEDDNTFYIITKTEYKLSLYLLD